MANEVTITIKGAHSSFGTTTVSNLDKDKDFSFTADGFTFTTSKGDTPSAYNQGGDLRIYSNGSLTLAGAANVTMTEVVFNTSSQGKKRQSKITPSVGEVTQTSGGATITWTGSANSVKFSVSQSNDYGTDGPTKNGQFDFLSVKITYTVTGASKQDAGLKFDQETFSIMLGDEFSAPTLTKATTAAVVYSSSDAAVAEVSAESGAVTIKGVGTATITAKAAENDEYYAGEASYTIEVLPAGTIYNNSCMAADCGFTQEIISGDVNPWQIDSKYGLKGSAFISNKANASDAVMASPVLDLSKYIDATISFEHAINNFKLNGTLLPTTAEALPYISVVAREVTEQAEETGTRAEAAGEWTKLADPAIPATYSWTYIDSGKLSLKAYDGKKIQIGFRYTSTADVAGTWEVKNVLVEGTKVGVGIESTLVDENAPVVYYNLQGMRVENPTSGLYIRVQGKKATKVMIRK